MPASRLPNRPLILMVVALAALVVPRYAAAQAARFTRISDTIKIFGETTLSDTYTFEAMVMRESATVPSTRLFGEQLDSQEDKGFSIAANGTGGSVWNGACTPVGVSTGATAPLNQWSHVAFVRNGAHLSLFIDGQMMAETVTGCSVFNAAGSNMAIGSFAYTAGGFVQDAFIGRVDWLRISSVARYTVPFAVPTCEPASDNATLMLFLFDDAPGTIAPVDSGPSHFNTAVATGFFGATAPTFGLPGRPGGAGTASITQSGGAVCPSSAAQFSVSATGNPPLSYQWQLETAPDTWLTLGNDPVPLPCGGNASHAYASPINSPTVSVGVHGCPGPFRVRCLVTSACGVATSNAVPLFIAPADIGRQGGLPGSDGLYDNNDFVVFIDRFFNMSSTADLGVQGGTVGSDGLWDNNDFVAFIELFFAGC